MKTKMRRCLAMVLTVAFVTSSSQAGIFSGFSGSTPVKNANGEVVQTDLPDPFADFTIISETLFDMDQLTDIPGRLVAIAEDAKSLSE